MRISEMSEDQAKQYLYDSYQSAVEAHGRGELEGRHPSHQIVKWAKLGRGEADQTDDNSLSEADPSTPGGNRGGKPPTVDGHYQLGMDSVPRFFKPDGSVVIGDAALALRARQNGDTAAMHRVIEGYGRLK